MFQAEDVLQQSFKRNPKNIQAQKVQAWCLLGKHEFAKALKLAKKLNKRVPDDIMVYGLLTDAHMELGNYDHAEEAAQWMLDMRPGNVPGLTRAAYLRELFGDIEGAKDLMLQAYQRVPRQELEDCAWILTQLGHLHMTNGQFEEANTYLTTALNLFPNYHYSLGLLGGTSDKPKTIR